jgi:hypothetical protein
LANVLTIFRRELAGYFATPIAYVFLIIFALLTGLFTFYVGNLYERGVADLLPFFNYLPWLLLVLVPAISMRLWSEERRAGTIELLMTLPVSTGAAVTGKWLAGVVFRCRRTGLHLADVVDGQLSRPAGQRRHCGELSRGAGSGRGVPCHRRVHVGAHVQPGDCFRAGCCRVFRVCHCRNTHRAGRTSRGVAGGRHRRPSLHFLR